ncbi:MFS transporter [Chromobacterium sinusclupearum]|uniref:MFS transporter n=2 Tax=Chromobacterium sinusclupearum TaxID=2077146 RepID=A0A2K4MQT8_9NEIS|nr:MFS transporter [Chromobacterium sinusclupearum]
MLIACLLVFVTQMATTVYLPSLPKVMSELSLSRPLAEATVAVFVMGAALAVPLWGDIAQRRGRRVALNGSLALFVLCDLLLALTNSGAIMLVLRAAQGIAAGGCAIVGRIVVRDAWSGDELVKRLSLLSVAFITAMGGGQFIGGLIGQYGHWRYGFLLLATIGLAIAWLGRNLPLQAGGVGQSGILSSYRELLARPRFLYASCAGGAGFAAIVVLQQASPFLFQQHYGLSVAAYGAVGLLLGAAYFAGALLVNRSVLRLGAARLLKGGSVSLALIALMLAGCWLSGGLDGASGMVGFLLLYGLLTFCQAVLFPNSMALAVSEGPDHGAHAMALCGFLLQTLAGLAAIGAVLLRAGSAWAWAMAALGLLCALLAMAWAVAPRRGA